MPSVLHALFWISVAAVVFAVGVAGMAAFDVGRVEILGQAFTARELFGQAGGTFVWVVASVGTLLAYGIWSERRYSRPLSLAAVLATVTWVTVSMFRSGRLSLEFLVVLVASARAIKSLASSPDIKAYYSREKN